MPFDEGGDDDYDLTNPQSKAVFVILWLYSVEPPIYYHLNSACRRMDATMLPHLGALARGLSIALEHAEKKRQDRIIPGY